MRFSFLLPYLQKSACHGIYRQIFQVYFISFAQIMQEKVIICRQIRIAWASHGALHAGGQLILSRFKKK
jgi:hypothetical protein